MKTYAIKTDKGYLATQGTEAWYQDTPKGWAEYTTKAHAENQAAAYWWMTNNHEIEEINEGS